MPAAWKDGHVLEVYELASQGYAKAKIARTMKVSDYKFGQEWRRNKDFRLAYKRGRAKYKKEQKSKEAIIDGNPVRAHDWIDYIYKHLEPELQHLWDEIRACEREKLGINRIRALMADQGLRAKQHLFLHAWVTATFKINVALRRLGLTKRDFDQWCRDPVFVQLVDEIQWHKDNFFEDQFMGLIAAGDTTAIMHAVKTRLANRGYNERHTVVADVNVHQQTNLTIDELDLSVAQKRALLDALRQQQGGEDRVGLTVEGTTK